MRSLKFDFGTVNKVDRRRAAVRLHRAEILKTYYFDVNNAERTFFSRVATRFERDDDAIQHSKHLAASFRCQYFPNQHGLVITILDRAGQKIHEEIVNPEGEQK